MSIEGFFFFLRNSNELMFPKRVTALTAVPGVKRRCGPQRRLQADLANTLVALINLSFMISL